jgi:hypothetical protein
MGVKTKIFKISEILMGMLFFLLYNCQRTEPVDLGEFDCSECYQEKPEWAPLNIKVTINDQNPYVPLVVYIGNIEDGLIDWVDTAFVTDYFVDVHPDRYYSVSAEYRDGEKTIFAVDGDKLTSNHNTNDCDAPCYYFKGGYIDVRLRN